MQWRHTLPYHTTASPTVIGDSSTSATWAAAARATVHTTPATASRWWHFPDGKYSTVIAAGANHLVVAGRTTLYMLKARGELTAASW